MLETNDCCFFGNRLFIEETADFLLIENKNGFVDVCDEADAFVICHFYNLIYEVVG